MNKIIVSSCSSCTSFFFYARLDWTHFVWITRQEIQTVGTSSLKSYFVRTSYGNEFVFGMEQHCSTCLWSVCSYIFMCAVSVLSMPIVLIQYAKSNHHKRKTQGLCSLNTLCPNMNTRLQWAKFYQSCPSDFNKAKLFLIILSRTSNRNTIIYGMKP